MDVSNTGQRVLRPRQHRNAYCKTPTLLEPKAKQTKPKIRNQMVAPRPDVKVEPSRPAVNAEPPDTIHNLEKFQLELRLEPWILGRYYTVVMRDLYVVLESMRPIGIENFGSIATNLAFKGERFCSAFNTERTVHLYGSPDINA